MQGWVTNDMNTEIRFDFNIFMVQFWLLLEIRKKAFIFILLLNQDYSCLKKNYNNNCRARGSFFRTLSWMGMFRMFIPYNLNNPNNNWSTVAQMAPRSTRDWKIQGNIKTIDNQPPVLYLVIRLWSEDFKHLIPIPIKPRWQGKHAFFIAMVSNSYQENLPKVKSFWRLY